MSSPNARKPGRDERGATLAEAIVAVGVFGLALLGLNGLLIGTIRTSELARDFTRARFLAAHRLEQIKNARYQDGNRDAFRDASDPCTDIDEVTQTVYPDEGYGAVDLMNGTRFTFRACAATPDIKQTPQHYTRSSYPATAQGNHDYQVNHGQYSRFRREVYIVDSLDYANTLRNVSLDGPNPDARDNLVLDLVSPSTTWPKTNFVKYVLVRVKWKDSHGQAHHVTLTSEKAFYIPAA
ncbi:MAG: hypothetical protein KBD01_19160 [Acidobacteria bacterium]|nr:hypothetical protein [Acidobacteriota bacterium]